MKKCFFLFFVVALVAFSFVPPVSAQDNWSCGGAFKAAFTDDGLKIVIPLSGWQLDNAPVDPDDRNMKSKRFPSTADVQVWVFYSFYDKSGKIQYGEKRIRADKDWTVNEATVYLPISLPSTATFTVVGKVPGYNKNEDESVFICVEDKYSTTDENGNPVYRFVADFSTKRIGKYKK
jgi:hypothetical protein